MILFCSGAVTGGGWLAFSDYYFGWGSGEGVDCYVCFVFYYFACYSGLGEVFVKLNLKADVNDLGVNLLVEDFKKKDKPDNILI